MAERAPSVARTAPGLVQPGSFWSVLSPEDATQLAALCALRDFARGRPVVYERQLGDRVLIIRTGWVKVHALTDAGREVVLAFRGPGDLVGELAALDEEPRAATVSVEEDVQALTLSTRAFKAFLASHPAVSMALLQLLGRRLRDADAKRVEFLESTTIQRVAARLLEFGDRFGRAEGDAIRIALPLTQEDLAGAAYASIESVGRALQTMRDLGCIETRRRELRIVDRVRLQTVRAGAFADDA
jgi:CRP/FNR family transcriptional regulator, cyclic AMP receptor protein